MLPPVGREEQAVEEDPKAQLVEFLHREMHLPSMAAEPHHLSEEHRQRLLKLQEASLAELTFLSSHTTAEDLSSSFLTRCDAGALNHIDEHARFLGLPGARDVRDRFLELAGKLGVLGPRYAGSAGR
jgi:hypothetical protein